MKILHNPRCRKSRETLEIIQEQNLDVQIIEYLKNTPSKEELKRIINLLKIQPFDLIRKGEQEFKDNFKGKELSDDEWINVMVTYPKLIERPIVFTANKAVIGRPPENVKQLF